MLLSDYREELEKGLDGLHCYCNTWHLEVNTSNTIDVVFLTGKLRKTVSCKFAVSVLETQDGYCYPGTLFNYIGRFVNAVDRQICQAKMALYGLHGKIRKLQLPVDVICHLFDACIVPILLYGCEVWGYSNLKKIEAIQLSFCKKS